MTVTNKVAKKVPVASMTVKAATRKITKRPVAENIPAKSAVPVLKWVKGLKTEYADFPGGRFSVRKVPNCTPAKYRLTCNGAQIDTFPTADIAKDKAQEAAEVAFSVHTDNAAADVLDAIASAPVSQAETDDAMESAMQEQAAHEEMAKIIDGPKDDAKPIYKDIIVYGHAFKRFTVTSPMREVYDATFNNINMRATQGATTRSWTFSIEDDSNYIKGKVTYPTAREALQAAFAMMERLA